MVSRSGFAALALTCAACGPTNIVLSLPPGLSPDGAVIFVVEVIDAPPKLIAAQASTRRLLSLDIDPHKSVRITALAYPSALSAYQINEGELATVSPERCGARPLPPQATLHDLELVDGESSGWRSQSSAPAALAPVRIEGPCPCSAFEVTHTTELPTSIRAFFRDGDEQTLLMDSRGGFSTLDTAGQITALPTATIAPDGTLRAVTQEPSGALWLAVDDVLWRGSPQAGFTRMSTLVDHTIRDMEGGMGAQGFELFATTIEGELLQVAPGAPRVLVRAQNPAINPSQIGRVVWLGPGHAAATEHEAYAMFWVQDGREYARIEFPIFSGGTEFFAAIPGLGLIAISPLSRVFQVQDFDFKELPNTPEFGPTKTILPFEGGFLYAGDSGALQQYLPEVGFCPTQPLQDQPRILGVARRGTQLIAVVVAPGAPQMQVVFLKPRPLQE